MINLVKPICNLLLTFNMGAIFKFPVTLFYSFEDLMFDAL